MDALRQAVRWFHAGRRLDVQALARELGISRVTLHRWVGTREQLITEVLWAATDRALSAVLARQDSGAGSVTAEVLAAWSHDVLAHPGVQQLQRDELDLFTRLTTRDGSSFQRRLIQRVRDLLARDRAAGRLTIDLDLDDLAFATVRIAETFIHTQAITGEDPDPARTGRILRALLR
jgi:AcrR family transcriptional regulator